MTGEQFNIMAEEHCRRAPPVRADGAGITEGELPGLRLTMRNGEVWFHPFTGNRGAPWRLTGEEAPPTWQHAFTTPRGLVVWRRDSGNGEPIFQATSGEPPTDGAGGYYQISALLKLKNDPA